MSGASFAGKVGYVAIGRNEGERLVRCLASLAREGGPIVYVDSGSTDGSVAAAEAVGAVAMLLDMSSPFTAARARNAGLFRLAAVAPDTDYVQFIDGDCELAAGWATAARSYLDSHAEAAVVCGRLRELRPEASIYNRLCDAEWATPPGDAEACGGIAMMRRAAVEAAGGFRESLIAGEEPELCVRLREAGWRIHRLDAEMANHDAAMHRFSQWWRRMVRGGHAFAEVSRLHRASPKRIWARETARALAWSALAPLALLLGLLHPAFLLLLLAYPAQVLRLTLRDRRRRANAFVFAVFNVLSKFPESLGVMRYWLSRLSNRAPRLIEYKS